MIATEAQNPNIDEAKTFIEAKGTPDFTKTSPSIVYDEVHNSNTSTWSTTSTFIFIGTGYTFDQETGMYTITDGSLRNPNEIDLNDGNTYYTNNKPDWVYTSSTINRISNISSKTDSATGTVTTTLTEYGYSITPRSYDTSTVGMYADNDDNGKTYYYRGSVASNYVKFGGYYWRVIRVNGDGTVRMIYDGTKPHANGESTPDRRIGVSNFTDYWNDNTYAGYMYANPNNFVETDSGSATYGHYYNVSNTSKYYFGTSYTLDKNRRQYKVSGDLVQGTIAPDKVGYYTCFSTDKDASCQEIFYTTKYNSPTNMEVKGLGYGTTSKEQAQSNDVNSTVKTYLDNWYKNNLDSYTDKLSSNAIFCNNRTVSNKISGTYTNEGYGIHPTIYGYEKYENYASQGKLGPNLSCPLNDSFNVEGTNGNEKLTYPVGLITADEAMMAGGINGSANTLYYLYAGIAYWTMTPSHLDNWFTIRIIEVTGNGRIDRDGSSTSRDVRPVINLDPDKITFTGNGTMQDPYVIS